MSGKILLDTNAILYLMKGDKCMIPFLDKNIAVSLISEMELLSFSKITQNEDSLIRKFLKKCRNFKIDRKIKEQTILLRRKYNIKLPDSIVAATAIVKNRKLISADKGFQKIVELDFYLITPNII